MEGRKYRKINLREAVAAATLALTSPVADVKSAELLPFVPSKAAEAALRRNEKIPVQIDFKKASLSAQEVLTEQNKAIASLLNGLPRDSSLNYLRDEERLAAESQAYAPDEKERRLVTTKSETQLKKLGEALEFQEYGLFAFADLDEAGEETHRLYVLQKSDENALVFVTAFRISMSANGFGNIKDSKRTPLGLDFIKSGYTGFLGEVVTAEKDILHYFKHVFIDKNGVEHRVVSDFGEHRPFMEPATVVTDRLTIDEQRGIHSHGTNRSGRWRKNEDGAKRWETYLGGPRSGACLRMSSPDVRNVTLNYARLPIVKGGVVQKNGTPIFIHATSEVLAKKPPIGEEETIEVEEPIEENMSRAMPLAMEPTRKNSTSKKFDPFNQLN